VLRPAIPWFVLALPLLAAGLSIALLLAAQDGPLRIAPFNIEVARIEGGGRYFSGAVAAIFVALILNGLAGTLGSPMVRYGLTDRRLIARLPWNSRRDWQIPASRIKGVDRVDHADGRATLSVRVSGPLGKGETEALEGISDPDGAFRVLATWPDVELRTVGAHRAQGRLSEALAQAIAVQLEPGEPIVWQSRTSAAAALPHLLANVLPVAIILMPLGFGLFALLWHVGSQTLSDAPGSREALVGGWVFRLIAIPFALPMLVFPPAMILHLLWRQQTSLIAVTDRRIIVGQGWRTIAIATVAPGDIESWRVFAYREDGRASLRIDRGKADPQAGTRMECHGIVDPDGAEQAIGRLIRTDPA
jgi:hypothetical protein